MRIVSGIYSGRRLVVPKDARVRPTGDRVREAWMSILGGELAGARVLDLFAGSGALGLEMLSRGAAHADFVELSPASLAALRQNIEALGAGAETTVHRGDALRFVERVPAGAFDVAVADPPYAMDAAERLVALFRRHPFASILSVEHPADRALSGDETRRYGDTALTFCRAPAPEP
jgi:16S rRNA (guanine966-N2)-methyltransferase